MRNTKITAEVTYETDYPGQEVKKIKQVYTFRCKAKYFTKVSLPIIQCNDKRSNDNIDPKIL